jgi:hypothetical protein
MIAEVFAVIRGLRGVFLFRAFSAIHALENLHLKSESRIVRRSILIRPNLFADMDCCGASAGIAVPCKHIHV